MSAVKAFQREVELYPAVLRLFRTRPRVFGEVPYYSKRVDLIFSSRDMRSLLAVELKLANWRKALKQAALNQVFCQLSYVGMPSYVVERLDERSLDIFRRHEVGLVSVGKDRAAIVIKAVRTTYFLPRHSEVVKEAMRGTSSLVCCELIWVGRPLLGFAGAAMAGGFE